MIPGMLHCGGGASPSTVDWQSLLEAWRERGQAPELVTATGGRAPGAATQTLCPYPDRSVADADRGPRCVAPARKS
jgi:feruloyl esterase